MDERRGDAPLGGRVTLRQLDFVEPPFHEGGRLLTEAGELAQIANGRTIRLLAFVEFARPDVIRGRHVHPHRAETLYVVRGELEAVFYLADGTHSIRRRLQDGSLAEVGPGVGHAYRAIAPTFAIEFSGQPFDPEGTLDLPPPPRDHEAA